MFIRYNNSTLHYARAGKGERHLLVFHGFGQDMNVFESLTRSLEQHYTFYVFDLYFHGASRWGRGEAALEKEEWKKTMALFLEENHISTFSLAAFSLGGKFALATLEAFPRRTTALFLIAPDGIKTSFWYSLATYPLVLRKLFRSMIIQPQRFIALARLLNKTGLADQGLIRFAESQMNSEEKRKRVYYSWVVFRHLKFNLPAVANLINENGIRVTIIAGEYDKVITPDNMRRFTRHLRQCRLEVLPCGHAGLITQSLPYLVDQ